MERKQSFLLDRVGVIIALHVDDAKMPMLKVWELNPQLPAYSFIQMMFGRHMEVSSAHRLRHTAPSFMEFTRVHH